MSVSENKETPSNALPSELKSCNKRATPNYAAQSSEGKSAAESSPGKARGQLEPTPTGERGDDADFDHEEVSPLRLNMDLDLPDSPDALGV